MSDSAVHPTRPRAGWDHVSKRRCPLPSATHVEESETPVNLEVPPQVRDSLDILKDAGGPNLVAVIFFGSRLLGASPGTGSAADLFVVVDDYHHFYRDLGSRLPAARRASIMAVLNRVLPPNAIHLKDPANLSTGAKCCVISTSDFAVALSPRGRDYFCRGRLVQRVQLVYARSEEDRDALEERLETARRGSLDWVPLYLGETFSVQEYCSRMLEVSYAGEIRPEARGRVREVFDAQQTYFRLTYGRILDEAVTAGKLQRVDHGYRLTAPPTLHDRLRWRLFFVKSNFRATLRLAKHMLTFDDWLDYIVGKTERRTGIKLELTRAERRLPALLLWPKAAKVLWALRSPAPSSQGDAENRPDQDRSPR